MKYLVIAGGDGYQAILCESLEEARRQFVEIHGPSNLAEVHRLRAYFDDEENWACEFHGHGGGTFWGRLCAEYECDYVEVVAVTEIRVKVDG